MKVNQNMARVYELLEQFDWNELSEQDKSYILALMSDIEYIDMRNTLKETKNLFGHEAEPTFNDSFHTASINNNREENIFIKLLKQPIQLYKVVASVAFIIGIYSVIYYFNPQKKNDLSAFSDTILIHKTDTVYSRVIDTVRIIKEKIVYIPQMKSMDSPMKLMSNSKNEYDCKIDICPNDIDEIKELAYNNNASGDTLLNDFIVFNK